MRLVASVLLLIALSLPVQAVHSGCSTSPAQAITAADHTFYVTTQCVSGCTAGAFVYEESNGKPGLQRNDPGHDDTLSGSCYARDTRIL